MRKSRTTEMKTIKTVLIGAGYRGMRLLRLMKQIHAYRITALFDPSSVASAGRKNRTILRRDKRV